MENAEESFSAYGIGETIKQYHRFLTHRGTEEIYVYADGVYRPHGEQVIREAVRAMLGDEATAHKVNEVVAHVRETTYAGEDAFDSPPPHLLCVQNGVLDLETGELRPHTPDLVFLSKLPVAWNPEARPERILKFLEEVVPDEDDRVTLLEYVGYCLWRTYPHQKALMLVGEGSNGKSTFIRLVMSLLGRENVAGRSLQSLEENPFAVADLVGKLANLCPDLPQQALRYTGTFKALTGGDLLKGERKFQQAFFFVNYAKLIFSANRLPRTLGDMSDAFFRRWLLIQFPNTFEGERRDPHLLQQLTTREELEGLLVYAALALARLRERGEFERSPTTEELRREYLRRSDPVRAFAEDCLAEDPASGVEKTLLYTLFGAYCRVNHLIPLNKDTFYRWLPGAVEVREEKIRQPDGGRMRVIVGIKVDPEQVREAQYMYTERYKVLVSGSLVQLVQLVQQSDGDKLNYGDYRKNGNEKKGSMVELKITEKDGPVGPAGPGGGEVEILLLRDVLLHQERRWGKAGETVRLPRAQAEDWVGKGWAAFPPEGRK